MEEPIGFGGSSALMGIHAMFFEIFPVTYFVLFVVL